jgi:hypothetical protein
MSAIMWQVPTGHWLAANADNSGKFGFVTGDVEVFGRGSERNVKHEHERVFLIYLVSYNPDYQQPALKILPIRNLDIDLGYPVFIKER